MKNKNLKMYKLFIIAFSIFFIVKMGISIYENYSFKAEYQEKIEDKKEKEKEGKIERGEDSKRKLLPSPFSDDTEKLGDIFRREKRENNLVVCSEIIDKYCSEYEEKNVIFSPTSFNHALGMAQVGASKDLDIVIKDILHTNNYNDIAKNYIKSLDEKKINENNMIHVANAFWVNNDFKIKDECKKELADYYNAESFYFTREESVESVKKINQWVYKNTYGLIEDIVEESDVLFSNTILTNTVYFNSEWECEWEVKTDEDGVEIVYPFYGNQHEMVSYMENNGKAYFENDYAKAFSCDYKIPGLTFIGILPKNEGSFTIESLDINELLSSGREYSGKFDISMPKLNYSTKFQLDRLLCDLGYKDLFLYPTYKLEGASGCVGSLVQKSKIELNEKYTKAAAVTKGTETLSSMLMEKNNIVLNRPFAFLIYDNNDDEILFMGKVVTTQMED